MISIRKATDELDRIDYLAHTLADVYQHAIWSTAQYAVEIDPHDVESFREHLTNLRDQAAHAACAEDWQVVQAAFRGELRDFRDRSTEQLTRLRSEFAGAVSAMQSFADSVTVTGGDHEDHLRDALAELKQAAEGDDIGFVRKVVGRTTDSLGTSVERLRRSHRIAIAQLRDEIRLLQKQVETERLAGQIDHPTGVWNRQKMEAALATFTDKDEPFSLLIIVIRNLQRLDGKFSRTAIDTAMKLLIQRLTAMLDDTALVGRWDNESFAVLLPVEPAAAVRLSREAARRLSGPYAVQQAGTSRQIALVVVTGVIDRSPGASHNSFAQRVEQMSNALAVA